MRLLYALLLTLGLAVPAAAEKTPEVRASTAAFIYRSTAPLTVAAVLAHMEKIDGLLVSLSAHYTQKMSVPETGMTSEVEGTVQFRKPERLRIEHTRPERQTIVADGKDIWIHRHSQGQVIQSKLADWKNADPTLKNLMQFGSYAKMLRAYNVRLDTTAARPTLLLDPKGKKNSNFHLRFSLDPATLFPSDAELVVGALLIRTTFSQIVFNPDIPDATFTFTPPKGVDVFRNFKPPRFNR